MKGYKTWIGVVGFIALGIYEIIQGQPEEGIQKIIIAVGLLGIGHKIEKMVGK